MKKKLLLSCVVSLIAPVLYAQVESTLIEYAGGGSGDSTSRGFYIENYPGSTLGSVTLFMLTSSSTSWPYQIGLTVTKDTYDGTPLPFRWADVSLNNVAKEVTIVFNETVEPGSTLCFKIVPQIQTGAPTPFYQTVGTIGELPDNIPYVTQTSGTTPPLDSYRRAGVAIRVTGVRGLNVNPNWSIQEAIDHAQAGDTVTVEEGNYYESLTLRSDVNVIGAGAGRTFLYPPSGNGVTASSVVNTEFSGFTVTPDSGSTSDSGFYISGGSPLIKNNHVNGFPRYGIRIVNGSTALVCGNRVQDNGDAGNAYLDYGIICLSSKALMANNLITGNETGCYIGWHASDGAQFINNTVANNTSEGVWAYQSNPIIMNNLIFSNQYSGVHASFAAATPVLTFNNVWGNGGGNYSSSSTGVINIGEGSISLDPLLDPAHADDFIPLVTSPCIDAGNPADIYNDWDGSVNDIGWTGGSCASPEVLPAPFEGFIFTSVGNIPVNYIGDTDGIANVPSADASALRIPAWTNAPFGGSPRIYGAFGVGISPSYYIIEAREVGETTWVPIEDAFSKVKYTITTNGVDASLESIGPVYFSDVPYYKATRNSANTYWAAENLRLVLNSRKLELADGLYDFQIRAFTGGNLFFPITPLPLTGPAGANALRLRINNHPPVSTIDAIEKTSGTTVDECAIVPISNATDNIIFTITASHPEGFMHSYSLYATRGRNQSGGTVCSDSYANHGSSVSWTGVNNAPFFSSDAMSAGHLDPWTSCSYQFRLVTWARTTDGVNRLYRRDYFWNLALNLGGADLDGDGDVDGDDLNLFSQAYGMSLN